MRNEFATWVKPIAERYRAKRQEVVEVAHRIPSDVWEAASPVDGWTFRDVLAHLAEGDAYKRIVIQAVLDGASTDLRPQNERREERNNAIRQRGASLTIGELIARAISDGEATQELLSRLADEHETVQVITSRTNPAPQTLGDCLARYRHDEEHLQQLRLALAKESAKP